MDKESGRWVAQLGYKGKHYNLGRFPATEEGKLQAAKAYEEGARRIHAQFACLDKNGTSTEGDNV